MRKQEVHLIIGYILLLPAIISVFMFIGGLFDHEFPRSVLSHLHSAWVGEYVGSSDQGGAYTSALPFYFGLMAIAGVYLIKDNRH